MRDSSHMSARSDPAERLSVDQQGEMEGLLETVRSAHTELGGANKLAGGFDYGPLLKRICGDLEDLENELVSTAAQYGVDLG